MPVILPLFNLLGLNLPWLNLMGFYCVRPTETTVKITAPT